MTRQTTSRAVIGAALTGALAGVAIAGSAGAAPTASSASALRGTIKLARGTYSHGKADGSYFRMLYPGSSSKYFKNPDSPASDKSFTLVRPGSAGGLILGRYQPQPKTAFDRSGNSLAGAIIKPTPFAGLNFGLATLSKNGPTPSLTVSGKHVSGQVQAITAEWNKLYFKQGGSVTGSFNPKTHRIAIKWRSLIKGGAFNGFTGVWHLEGTLR